MSACKLREEVPTLVRKRHRGQFRFGNNITDINGRSFTHVDISIPYQQTSESSLIAIIKTHSVHMHGFWIFLLSITHTCSTTAAHALPALDIAPKENTKEKST